jgi:hypothetical protein
MWGYTAGLWDLTGHGAFVVDGLPLGAPSQMTNAVVEYGLRRLGIFCPPHGVTIQQAADVFCKHLRDRPEERHTTAAIVFGEAMAKAWPCK